MRGGDGLQLILGREGRALDQAPEIAVLLDERAEGHQLSLDGLDGAIVARKIEERLGVAVSDL